MNKPFIPENILRVAVDIGGTFTDGVASISPGGRIWVSKSPTTPNDPGEAVSTVIEDLLRQGDVTEGGAGPPPAGGGPRPTPVPNPLNERKGARTAFGAP